METHSSKQSAKRRILFYGGCHAATLARIFRAYCDDPDVQFDDLVNFELIAKKVPFPYEKMASYDAVVYSPILNKPGYETERLEEVCSRFNVPTICYPWLEWRGYHPFVAKGAFFTGDSWHYPGILKLASQERDLSALSEQVSDMFFDTEKVTASMEVSTARMIANEKSPPCTFGISDFVLEHFRTHRLFLTPDHPTKILYNYVVRKINSYLDLSLDDSFYYSAAEPQYGFKTPIHPRVGEILGLKFSDADFQNVESELGPRSIPLREFILLCRGFRQGQNMFRSVSATSLLPRDAVLDEIPAEERVPVPASAFLQLQIVREANENGVCEVDVNWAPPGLLKKIKQQQLKYIVQDHWVERHRRRPA